jgi:hypothetical protein
MPQPHILSLLYLTLVQSIKHSSIASSRSVPPFKACILPMLALNSRAQGRLLYRRRYQYLYGITVTTGPACSCLFSCPYVLSYSIFYLQVPARTRDNSSEVKYMQIHLPRLGHMSFTLELPKIDTSFSSIQLSTPTCWPGSVLSILICVLQRPGCLQ